MSTGMKCASGPRMVRSVTSRLTIVIALACLGLSACGGDNPVPTSPSGSLDDNRVKLEAVVTNRSGSCPNSTFRLGAIEVRTTSDTNFGLPCAQVLTGTPVEAVGPVITDGVLIAREVQRDDDALGDAEFEVRGPIASLSSSNDCTSTDGRSVSVLGLRFFAGSFFTRFMELPTGCAGLTSGLLLRAKGALPPAQPLRAAEVERRQ